MQLSWLSTPDAQGTKWHGQLEAANLTATENGRPIAWSKPMAAVLDAHDAPGTQLVVDQARCESDFLHVEGAGSADNLIAKLTLSLGKLADQLGQFVNLGGTKFTGEGSGDFTWKRRPDRQFTAAATSSFTASSCRPRAASRGEKTTSCWVRRPKV